MATIDDPESDDSDDDEEAMAMVIKSTTPPPLATVAEPEGAVRCFLVTENPKEVRSTKLAPPRGEGRLEEELLLFRLLMTMGLLYYYWIGAFCCMAQEVAVFF